MKPQNLRSVLWILAATAAAVLAIGVRAAALATDPTSALAVTAIVELALGVASFILFAARSGQPTAHTRARWEALDVVRGIASMLVFGYLIGLVVATSAGLALDDPWMLLALIAPTAGAVACIIGGILERERFVTVRTRRVAASSEPLTRKVYETRHGAVLVKENEDGLEEIVLTGADGKRDVDAVERAIDERGWQEAETPDAKDLNHALRRWGILRGNTE